MSLNQRLALLLASFSFYNLCYATPNVEIIQSCTNQVAANSTITMTELPPPVAKEVPDNNCDFQYEVSYDSKIYGHVMCNGEPYLIVADSKIKLDTATNLSVNPSVKPDIPLLSTTEFWKIDKDSQSYLCVWNTISGLGSSANSFQYYIVENAFNSVSPVELYFYFFDRDIAPLFPN